MITGDFGYSYGKAGNFLSLAFSVPSSAIQGNELYLSLRSKGRNVEICRKISQQGNTESLRRE